jgi:hypothetical protein
MRAYSLAYRIILHIELILLHSKLSVNVIWMDGDELALGEHDLFSIKAIILFLPALQIS